MTLKHWILTDSGRSALSTVLMAYGTLRPGSDEVVVPAYTAYSVPAAVVRAGLRVRLCDIEMETLGLMPKELERTLTSRTLGVVATYLYGIPCQIGAIGAVARECRVPVVEDGAQAMGATCVGKPVGTFGEAVVFTLSRGKTLPAAGGGLIGTNDEELAACCRQVLAKECAQAVPPRPLGLNAACTTALMSVFIRPSLYWLPAALPFLRLGASIFDPAFAIAPMSRFQEALAGRVLPDLEKLQDIRRTNAVRLARALAEINGVWVLWPREGDSGGFLRLVVLLRDPAVRGRILATLQKQGLGASGGYPAPLSDIPELRPYVVNADEELTVARRVSRQLITLPTHPWVEERDIERIVQVFRECLQ